MTSVGWRHGIGAGLTALLLGTGCAQVEAPSGGPVDSEKPRVVGMFPDSGSTGELPDTLSILFSKKMDRKSVRDWLFVSPPVAIRERLWKDNRLDLPLLSPPDSGQTYSVLLGAEVKDLRGNALTAVSNVVPKRFQKAKIVPYELVTGGTWRFFLMGLGDEKKPMMKLTRMEPRVRVFNRGNDGYAARNKEEQMMWDARFGFGYNFYASTSQFSQA